MGANVTHGGHGQVLVKLNGHTQGFHDTQHSLSKEEVGALRKFLSGAGVDPARDWPSSGAAGGLPGRVRPRICRGG